MRPFNWLRISCGVWGCLGAVALGYAQSVLSGLSTTNSTSPAPALPTNGAKLIRGRPAISNRVIFNGVVTGLNLSNRWFEVRGTNGTQRFSFQTNAQVLLTGNPIPISDLRPGDRVGIVGRVRTNELPEVLGVRVGARPPGQGAVKRTDPAPTD